MAMKKILVIDDETDICNMLKDYLQMSSSLHGSRMPTG